VLSSCCPAGTFFEVRIDYHGEYAADNAHKAHPVRAFGSWLYRMPAGLYYKFFDHPLSIFRYVLVN